MKKRRTLGKDKSDQPIGEEVKNAEKEAAVEEEDNLNTHRARQELLLLTLPSVQEKKGWEKRGGSRQERG